MSVKKNIVRSLLSLVLICSGCNGQAPGDSAAKETKKNIQPSFNQESEKNWPLKVSVDLDREKCATGKQQELFLLVGLETLEQVVTTNDARPAINLSLVLDRSGSMADKNKLDYVQKSAGYVVEQLGSVDQLGIVEYDDVVTQLWPLSAIKSKDMVKTLINDLHPRGSTNLCGGMICGVEQIKSSISNDKVNRIILLSDGLANTGITSPVEISRLARQARQLGMTISTMGVGLDYNEDLLQSIAESGGGKYYFIENPAQIQEIFQEEIGSLFKTVAKNITVEFSGEACVDSIAVYGYQSVNKRSTATVNMGNVCGGSKSMLLMRLYTNVQKKGKESLGTLSLSFFDCKTNQMRKKEIPVSVNGVKDSAEANKSIRKAISAEATLILADNEHEEYVRQYERGEKELAQQNLAKLSGKIDGLNESLSDIRIRKKIASIQMEAAEMNNADLSIENRQAYLKTSKQRFYYAKKGDRGKYLMQQGDQSYDVKQLQKKLNELKLYNGNIDGTFSDSVKNALQTFQQSNSIEADGIAGPETLKKLGLY